MGCANSRCRGFAGDGRAKKTSEEEIEESRRAQQRIAGEYERRLASARLQEDVYRRRRCMDHAAMGGGEDDGGVEEWRSCSSSGGGSVAEQARREETVEKWKQLYLAVKTELDELIHRTGGEGRRSGWAGEENKNKEAVEELQGELRKKEESIEALTSKIAAMHQEATKKDREIDILRQCLKILGTSPKKYLK